VKGASFTSDAKTYERRAAPPQRIKLSYRRPPVLPLIFEKSVGTFEITPEPDEEMERRAILEAAFEARGGFTAAAPPFPVGAAGRARPRPERRRDEFNGWGAPAAGQKSRGGATRVGRSLSRESRSQGQRTADQEAPTQADVVAPGPAGPRKPADSRGDGCDPVLSLPRFAGHDYEGHDSAFEAPQVRKGGAGSRGGYPTHDDQRRTIQLAQTPPGRRAFTEEPARTRILSAGGGSSAASRAGEE